MMLLKEAFSAWKQRAAERVAVEEAQNAQINEKAEIKREQTRLAHEQLFNAGGLPWSKFPFGSNSLIIADSGIIDGKTSETYERLLVSRTPNGIHVVLNPRPVGYPELNSFKLCWRDNIELPVAMWVAEEGGIARYEFNAYRRELERRERNCKGFVFDPVTQTGQYELRVRWPDAPLASVNLTMNGEGIYPGTGNVLDTIHGYVGSTYNRRIGIDFI